MHQKLFCCLFVWLLFCFVFSLLLFFFFGGGGGGLKMQNFPCPGRPSPLGCFAPSQSNRDMEIYVISTGARSLIIQMNVSETANGSKLDVIVLPHCYISNLCPKYLHQRLCCLFFFCFFLGGGSKCKNVPALEGGHPTRKATTSASKTVLQKSNHAVPPPPPDIKMDLRPCFLRMKH